MEQVCRDARRCSGSWAGCGARGSGAPPLGQRLFLSLFIYYLFLSFPHREQRIRPPGWERKQKWRRGPARPGSLVLTVTLLDVLRGEREGERGEKPSEARLPRCFGCCSEHNGENSGSQQHQAHQPAPGQSVQRPETPAALPETEGKAHRDPPLPPPLLYHCCVTEPEAAPSVSISFSFTSSQPSAVCNYFTVYLQFTHFSQNLSPLHIHPVSICILSVY